MTVRAADLADGAERGRIDAYVAAHPAAELFHRPQWSLAVARGCGQRAHYLIAERHGRLTGCLPLTEMRSPLFGNALVSTGFGTGGGPIADDPAIAERLVAAGWTLAGELGCRSMELRGGPVPEGWAAQTGVYAGFSKPLPEGGDEAILRAMKRRHRSIRRAREFDLEIRIGNGAADRALHYAVYAEMVRNLGSPVYPRALFAAMLDLFGADADILTVLKDGRPLASAVNFYFRGAVMPYWGGGNAAAREFSASEMMYYQVMCHGARRGCTSFDFGRSKLGTGTYSFKENWGFEPRPLVYAVRAADGAGARVVNPLDPKYRLQVALWKKLPLPLANRLGPPIARGLG
ncbi:MAG TPA: FemAB family XrtA/PEP-CTERM system-associated protein [Allosphingosinicella sp.]|nr:FemAB family XrtA/PEP-CTERM system-associated protein [Allosphingosinicella sp.]